MKRFTVTIETAGGTWSAFWSDSWEETWKSVIRHQERSPVVYDHEYGFTYYFNKNKWTKTGFLPCTL